MFTAKLGVCRAGENEAAKKETAIVAGGNVASTGEGKMSDFGEEDNDPAYRRSEFDTKQRGCRERRCDVPPIVTAAPR